jgi:hypothetical protein
LALFDDDAALEYLASSVGNQVGQFIGQVFAKETGLQKAASDAVAELARSVKPKPDQQLAETVKVRSDWTARIVETTKGTKEDESRLKAPTPGDNPESVEELPSSVQAFMMSPTVSGEYELGGNTDQYSEGIEREEFELQYLNDRIKSAENLRYENIEDRFLYFWGDEWSVQKRRVNDLVDTSIQLYQLSYIIQKDENAARAYHEKFQQLLQSNGDPKFNDALFTFAGFDVAGLVEKKVTGVSFEEFRAKMHEGLINAANYSSEYARIGRNLIEGTHWAQPGLGSQESVKALQASYLIGYDDVEYEDLGRTSFLGNVAGGVPLGIGSAVSAKQAYEIIREVEGLQAMKNIGLISNAMLDSRKLEAEIELGGIAIALLISPFTGWIGKGLSKAGSVVGKTIASVARLAMRSRLIAAGARSTLALLKSAGGSVGKAMSMAMASSLGKTLVSGSVKISGKISDVFTDLVGRLGLKLGFKKSIPLSEETFAKLAFDPAKGKITSGSIEELRTGLAAERAGLIDRIMYRGDPKFPGREMGFEFTTKSGIEIDVKAFRANSLASQKELLNFQNKFAMNNVKILVDPRNLTSGELNAIIQRASSVGIKPDRFIIPDPKFFSRINVSGKIY